MDMGEERLCEVKSLRSFESCRRDYGSYTAGNGEPLQDFEHGSDLMEFIL